MSLELIADQTDSPNSANTAVIPIETNNSITNGAALIRSRN